MIYELIKNGYHYIGPISDISSSEFGWEDAMQDLKRELSFAPRQRIYIPCPRCDCLARLTLIEPFTDGAERVTYVCAMCDGTHEVVAQA